MLSNHCPRRSFTSVTESIILTTQFSCSFVKQNSSPRGCMRLLQAGYLYVIMYGFCVCTEKAVNYNINSGKKSSGESKAEAIISREPLLTEP